jgi:hypothetical protein
LPVRRRVRLAWLRRLWLRRLWVLLAVGPLPHLLKRTTFKFSGQKRVFVAGLILHRAGISFYFCILSLFAVSSHLR